MARMRNRWRAMESAELRNIMRRWPLVMQGITDDWALNFAANIWENAANGQWRPTVKQAKTMRKFIVDLGREDTRQR